MQTKIFKLVFTFLSILFIHQLNAQDNMKYNKLSPEEERVIINKGTEMPYTGEYYNNKEKVHTPAASAGRSFINPRINLIRIVAGPVSMMKLRVL